MEHSTKDPCKKTQIYLALSLFIFTFAVYANALQNEFVGDDHYIIENYTLIHDFRNIPRFFSEQDTLQSDAPTGYYRPLARMSYMVDYYIWGLNPFGYHLFNILLHAAVTVVFFLTAGLLLGRRTAYVSALLFAAHPIHVESVTWITGRNNILAALFILLSFYWYVLREQETRRSMRNFFYALSLVFFTSSLLSKEFALAFPVFLIMYFFSGVNHYGIYIEIPRTGQGKATSSQQRGTILSVALTVLPFLLLTLLYLIIRSFVTGPSGGFSFTSFPHDALNSVKIFYVYLKMLVIPVKSISNYFVPYNEQFFNLRGVIAVFTISVTAASGVYFFRTNRGLFFALGFFFVFLLPASGVLYRNPVPVAERYAYVASLGFCLFAGICAEMLIRRKRVVATFLLIGILSFYSYETIQRNRTWKDDLAVAVNRAEAMPGSYSAFYQLGNEFRKKGDLQRAITAFKRAAELNPEFPDTHLSLGMTYHEQGMSREAMIEYREVQRLRPDNTEVRSRLAYLYFNAGMVDEAINELSEVLRTNPEDEAALTNLKNLYEEKALRKQR